MSYSPPPTGWQSYDSVVETYAQAAVPRFEPLARDLVTAIASPLNAVVLDIGTGTGLAAQIARKFLGPGALVVGTDPSIPMLRHAAGKLTAVGGMLPGLPFRDAVFDVVLANLVLSHVVDYDAGLADAARVLRLGGKLGCTAWGPNLPVDDQNQAGHADEIMDAIMLARGLSLTPPAPAVPSEDRLRDRDTLEAALHDAGLIDTKVNARTYRWSNSIEEYLSGREWRPRSRYIRQQTDDQLWQDIHDQGASQLRRRFGTTIQSSGQVLIAVGTKT